MFSAIAPRYDRTNTVLSFGVHHAWRRATVRASGAKAGQRVLDVATGTGDLALAFRRRVTPGGQVVGLDFAPPMARQAKRKAKQPSKAASTPLHITVGDALRLPCRDASFDVASIAFGIRNVDDPQAGVAEMKRVVKPGGRVVVLEFGQPRGPLGVLYRWYSRHVMPRMGGWLTGDRAAYEYLPETASRFPSGDAFVAIMAAAGLHDIKSKRLTGGIAWLYVGTA